jgi:hypothetical protein
MYMKSLKYLIYILSITILSIQLSSAITYKCPGDPATLTWSSTNCSAVQNTYGVGACYFGNSLNGSQPVSLSSGSCTVSIQCTNPMSSTVATDQLVIKTLGQCGMCPAGSVPNNTTPGSIYAGDGCIRPTATITGGSCIGHFYKSAPKCGNP